MRKAALLALVLAAVVRAQQPVAFTDAEVKRIVALGPWPPARVVDPSNRASGNAAAIALGERLFRDPSLSGPGTIACSNCHVPARAFADGLPRGQGIARGDRNTPSLLNVGGQRWYGWDGAQDSLWAQSLRPLLDTREMGSSLAKVASQVRAEPSLRAGYVAAFGREPPDDDQVVAVDAAKAVAAYLQTLVSPRSAFDDFRDALARGDREAASRYPVLAQRGLAIFIGSGNCTACHSGPRLSNGEFGDVGIPFFAEPGRVDPGRFGGIRSLQASPYNLLGAFNDDPTRSTATSTRFVALDHRNYGEFKVPSLRNVARTAPYMHDGSLATLREVVRHYSNLDLDRLHADGERILKPLDLDKYDVDALVAFLQTL
ncbi:MAG TPA: cytochrome c peroxidase [Casimicrobiaceae bacterium]|nr:cytochrome c peroxidase [Casimicrobiaceae bacterium]